MGGFNREAFVIEIYLKTPAQRGQRTREERGYPLKLRMEYDPVLALTQQVERDGIMLVFIKPGRTAPNTFIERCNRMHRTEY